MKEIFMQAFNEKLDWSIPEHHKIEVSINGKILHGAAFVSQKGDKSISGSAAGFSFEDANFRAQMELLERMAIIESNLELEKGDSWKISQSNGVALHSNLEKAKEAAFFELQERNDILRSWFCETVPTKLNYSFGELSFLFDTYDLSAYQVSNSTVVVVGVPIIENKAVLVASACAYNLEQSFSKACKEFLQKLIFTWEEPLPQQVSLEPDPLSHLDFYSLKDNYPLLSEWLTGQRYKRLGSVISADDSSLPQELKFELLGEKLLEGKYYCVRVSGGKLLPLTFGVGHPNVKQKGLLSHVDLFHPIS